MKMLGIYFHFIEVHFFLLYGGIASKCPRGVNVTESIAEENIWNNIVFQHQPCHYLSLCVRKQY